MTTKKVVIELYGKEECTYLRTMIVELPEGTTKEELAELDWTEIDELRDPPEWELEDPGGIWPETGQIGVKDADSAQPAFVRIANEHGKLKIVLD